MIQKVRRPMPTYEYRCEKCGHEFERDQRITDEPVKKCPSCRAARVKRLISTTSFVLKGGGWYSDLYSSGKGKPDTGESKTDSGEGKTASGGEGKTASGGEGKSASGSEAATSKEATPKPSSGGDAKPAADKGGKRSATKTEAA
jgi:putative FmdB family regulatory protein